MCQAVFYTLEDESNKALPSGAGILASLMSERQLWCGTVGLHPAGLQALCLPSLKREERAQRQGQRHQWFNRWELLMAWSRRALGQHPTVGG